MDLDMLTRFFMWCTIIHVGLLIIMTVMMIACRRWIYRVHTRWFPMSEQTHTALLYGMIGTYKILVYVLCIVPYVALLILK